MSVGGHQMTRAEKLSLPQLYNQYLYTAYYIRVGLPGKVISFYIVPLDPAYPALAGWGTFRSTQLLNLWQMETGE